MAASPHHTSTSTPCSCSCHTPSSIVHHSLSRALSDESPRIKAIGIWVEQQPVSRPRLALHGTAAARARAPDRPGRRCFRTRRRRRRRRHRTQARAAPIILSRARPRQADRRRGLALAKLYIAASMARPARARMIGRARGDGRASGAQLGFGLLPAGRAGGIIMHGKLRRYGRVQGQQRRA